MKEKFGKNSEASLDLKNIFIKKNDFLYADDQKINKQYLEQPKRVSCMNCLSPIGDISFIKQEIPYSICENCSHLNGFHQDTQEFAKSIYSEDKDEAYVENYSAKTKEDYLKRVKEIYLPKANFLYESLIEAGDHPNNYKILDFGAGLGYFVSSLGQLDFKDIRGLEVSKSCVNFANTMMKKEYLSLFKFEETKDILSHADDEIISMIGVLEHLQNPYEIIKTIKNNNKIKYIYISVPIFGIAVFLELFFPNIMHRQLSRDHTHLYTKKSLEWIINHFDMKAISAWWFGLDMVDLYRLGSVSLSKSQDDKVINIWQEIFQPLIDNMQMQVDKSYQCSEVHMLIRTNSS